MSSEEKKAGPGFVMVDGDADSSSEPASEGGHEAIPAIDFSTFVLSLGTSALYQMGQLGDSESGEAPVEPDLLIARQTIDTLEMLSEKTRGNLEPEEAKLLEGILYELHLRYVEAHSKDGSGSE